jgi:hypothetical protein
MTTDGGGWTLAGITNGASYDSTWQFVSSAPVSAVTGEYTKDLRGNSFTQHRYDCGTSDQGVVGFVIQAGTFNWPAGGTLSATGVSTVSENVVWVPRLPGDADTANVDASSFWNNHYSSVHYPNFGSTGFPLIDGRAWGIRPCFTCNPLSSNYGDGDTYWFPGASGTRFVRYWLR